MDDFIARNSRWRLLLLVCAAAGFVVLGLSIGGLFGPSPRPYLVWFGWFCAVFFGACGIVAAIRLFDGAEQVRISAQGIRARQWSDDTIP